MYRKEKKHIDHVVDADLTAFYDLSIKEFDVFEEIQLKEAFDNMPAGIQESERGERMQEAIDNLESAVGSVEEAVDYLLGIE